MKEENILKDIKELLILLCKIQLNSNHNNAKKEDLYREEYNKRMENKKYFKKNNHIQSIDIYGLITDAIYTRLDIFFQEGEWDDYMLTRIANNIVEEMQQDGEWDD